MSSGGSSEYLHDDRKGFKTDRWIFRAQQRIELGPYFFALRLHVHVHDLIYLHGQLLFARLFAFMPGGFFFSLCYENR